MGAPPLLHHAARWRRFFPPDKAMPFDKIIFDHGARHFELIEALGCFRKLHHFAQDQAALRAHLAGVGRPQQVTAEGDLEGVSDKDVERFFAPIADSIDTAISAYRRQLVVVIVSIVEAAITDAFSVLFAYRPETIKGLYKDAAGEGFNLAVPIDDLMAATSLDELRLGIVERAVAYACQGKGKKTVLRRLARLYSDELASSVETDFLGLVERRNIIVHENSKRDVTNADIENAFDVALSFVQELGRLVARRSLPLHDPMQVCVD